MVALFNLIGIQLMRVTGLYYNSSSPFESATRQFDSQGLNIAIQFQTTYVCGTEFTHNPL